MKGLSQNDWSKSFEAAPRLAQAKEKATNYTQKTVHKTRGATFASQKVYCFSFLCAMPPPEQTGGFPTGLFVFYGAVSVC